MFKLKKTGMRQKIPQDPKSVKFFLSIYKEKIPAFRFSFNRGGKSKPHRSIAVGYVRIGLFFQRRVKVNMKAEKW
jgi:hypothetical protein